MKRVLSLTLMALTLLTPVSLSLPILTGQVHAEEAQCRDSSGRPILAFGRRRHCGYFKNNYDTQGIFVRPGGVPGSVNTAGELIQLLEGDLNSGNAHRMTGAKFVILNMIDRPAGLPQSVTAAELQDWKDRVNNYASTSENGSQSFGPNGRIDWFVSLHLACGTVNTFYQDDEDDVAPYTDTPSNSDCEVASSFTNFIVFRDTSGNVKYTIRRVCMNPVGNLENGLDKPKALDYSIQPSIGTEVNGDSAISSAEVGDSVKFTYQATNAGPDSSPVVNCTIYANIHSGYFPTPGSPTSGNNPVGYSPPPTSCPKVFNRGINDIASETIIITAGNQTICRSLFVSPATPTIASRGYEVCIPIANKPYARAFGADVSAGNGLANVPGICAQNNNAAIVGWNKRSGGNFAGAGTQHAAFALKGIQDFATALGASGGADASAPSSLSFTNTTINPGAGDFGGNFDILPCIANHYSTKPASTLALPASFNTMVSGSYSATGPVTLNGGVVDKDEQISLYVEGDVFINGNISFAGGTWSLSEIPTFRLVVLGNIYVGRNVTQLDGLFVAQKTTGGSGGGFYTCVTGASALPLDGSLFSICNTKLTVNGGVVADTIYLLRTSGSLGQSSANETSQVNQASEVFNYGPAHWLMQPPATGPTPDYDAIISLPPIL